MRQEQSTGYSNLDPHFGSGQPLIDAIKHARGTTRRRQCEDGVGAVVQGIVDFEHHSLADVANVAVATRSGIKPVTQRMGCPMSHSTSATEKSITVEKVEDAYEYTQCSDAGPLFAI